MKKSILKYLEGLELAGITFIRNYIQFLFDGWVLSIYTMPQIRIQNEILAPLDPGYYDKLCFLIGKKIVSANKNEAEESIIVEFENEIMLFVSLKLDDRVCAEAVLLQNEQGEEWNIW